MNILIVDDEEMIRNVIKEYCLNEKYNVFEAEDGLDALNKLKENDIDLVVMDIMMPKLDGFSACKEIKNIKNIPIIVLSARSQEFDKLYGFDLGIDDYVTKPFSPKELMARIKAVMKRNKRIENIFKYQDLVINLQEHIVFIDKEEIFLTPKQYDILYFFIKNPNTILSREQILNHVWGYDYYGDDRTIDSHIKILRNNLGKYRDLIVTIRGIGYKFDVKEEN